ncbi:MAG: DUF58 domain-containing protein [Nanoarchaeota archaeon]|nr:DUF58 domain-containing protein [Nanoarchaeota archaeon]MBU1030822.1 DUF58 domain-containing protein [Nanoarchaeota archaeon]MBU1850774.1 DUF58 domain-containing protein [Nanoarchaeota archaeon]
MPIKELELDFVKKMKDPQFQVKRKILSKILEGELQTIFKGKGMEFTGFRQYVYGDDASLIDWPASLRAKETLIREFEEYRNFEIFILLDVSNSMLFSSTNKLKCEYAADVAFSLMYSLMNVGDKIGMALFTDKLVTRRIPRIGRENYLFMTQDLTNPNNYGGNFDFEKAIMQTGAFLGGKTLIIIISDFIGLKPGWSHAIKSLSQRYEIMGVMIRDPRDQEIPRGIGQYVIEDPYTKEKLYIDTTKYSKIYKEQALKEQEEIKKQFRIARSDLLTLTTDKDFFDDMILFFKKRTKIFSKMK